MEALLMNSEVMVHDFIVGELASGNLKPRKEILSLLHFLPKVPVSSQGEILAFIENYSLHGQGLSFIDIHLLASAKLADISFWTLDQRLAHTAAKLKLAP